MNRREFIKGLSATTALTAVPMAALAPEMDVCPNALVAMGQSNWVCGIIDLGEVWLQGESNLPVSIMSRDGLAERLADMRYRNELRELLKTIGDDRKWEGTS